VGEFASSRQMNGDSSFHPQIQALDLGGFVLLVSIETAIAMLESPFRIFTKGNLKKFLSDKTQVSKQFSSLTLILISIPITGQETYGGLLEAEIPCLLSLSENLNVVSELA